jgi:polysaccharide biosynthesis protein PslH
MKILWVKAEKILPVNTGGRIRSYNIMKQLAARHELTFLSYYGGLRDILYETEIKQHFPGAMSTWTGAPDTKSFRGVFSLLRNLSEPVPFSVAKFTNRAVQETLEHWLGDNRFDVAVCDFLSASRNFPAVLTTPTVLFQHNVESAMWQRQAFGQAGWLKRFVFRWEADKLARFEPAAVRRFDHIIAVSDADRELMKRMTDPGRITVVPTGVDTRKYAAHAVDAGTQPLVVFVGQMNYEPNIDGVEYFCREVWPLVRARVPEARFRIVGKSPDRRVKKLACDSVEVTGTVPSVIEHLQEARVVVVPLRMGGGTRLKIFEAMAAGKAVVSSSVGAEGLAIHPGHDILIADDAPIFADDVVTLLNDEKARLAYGKAAGALAAQYDWSAISERFGKVLARVAGLSSLECSAALQVAG